jgi:hypothetical protein
VAGSSVFHNILDDRYEFLSIIVNEQAILIESSINKNYELITELA